MRPSSCVAVGTYVKSSSSRLVAEQLPGNKKKQDSVNLSSTQQGKWEARTIYKRTNTWNSVSLRPAMKMTSTYELQTRKHTRLCQPYINPARKWQARTSFKHANTQDSVSLTSIQQWKMSSTYGLWMHKHTRLSASDQPSKENVKRVPTERANTQDLISQIKPSKENVERTSCECVNTWDSVSLRSTQQGKMSSTYGLWMHKHTRLHQP